jgi:uncharacterized membrane protein YhaH (DUF805 family)
MAQASGESAKRIDQLFWYCAIACLATSILSCFLLRAAFSADPSDTGIARSYAVSICGCLIFALPVFLITVRWSAAGMAGMWLLACVVAALAALAHAFGLVTPLLAILIFSASIATAIFLKDRSRAQAEACAISPAE